MSQLKYKTRPGEDPHRKPSVFFSCHPDDFDNYFRLVTDQLLEITNCCIWYNPDPEDTLTAEQMETDLAQMQLFVFPVTSRFLNTENHSLDQDFTFAVREHIPILPLMEEEGLESIFNKKCGTLQFLNPNQKDSTEIPFQEKLEQFLKAVLIGDELAGKIRQAFDAYIFLSYRKKDRGYAQKLMKLIHANDFCEDIAIWYDEFLIPGEDFNDSIEDALNKSSLFALVVTPNIVNENNYVMEMEYPMAREREKYIFPAEMVSTDIEELNKHYKDFPPLNRPEEETFNENLYKAVQSLAIKENDKDPQHNFFIGLAYLSGIDVEKDGERAARLIGGASKAGLIEATEKMIDIYTHGIGVDRSYFGVAEYEELYIEQLDHQLTQAIEQQETPETIARLKVRVIHECFELANILLWKLRQQEKAIVHMEKTIRKIRALYDPEKRILQEWLVEAYYTIAHCYLEMYDTDNAISNYEKALSFIDEAQKKSGYGEIGRTYSEILSDLGILYVKRRDDENALKYFLELEKVASKEYMSQCRKYLGEIYLRQGRTDLAESYLAQKRPETQGRFVGWANLFRQAQETDAACEFARKQGDTRKALELLDQLAASLEMGLIMKKDETDDDYYASAGVTYQTLGKNYSNLGMEDKGEEYLLKAMKICEAYRSRSKTLEFRVYQLQTAGLADLARHYRKYKREQKLISVEEQIIAFNRDALAVYDDISTKKQQWRALNNLAHIYANNGKFQRAAELQEEAYELIKLVNDSHKDRELRKDTLHICFFLGNIYTYDDRHQELSQILEDMEILAADFDSDIVNKVMCSEAALAHELTAQLYAGIGGYVPDRTKANQHYTKAAKLFEECGDSSAAASCRWNIIEEDDMTKDLWDEEEDLFWDDIQDDICDDLRDDIQDDICDDIQDDICDDTCDENKMELVEEAGHQEETAAEEENRTQEAVTAVEENKPQEAATVVEENRTQEIPEKTGFFARLFRRKQK